MEHQSTLHLKSTKGTNYYSSPSLVSKLSGIMVRLADRFTALYRNIKQAAALVEKVHQFHSLGPSQLFKIFRSPFNRLLWMWEIEIPFTTQQRFPLTSSYHHKTPQFIIHWCVMPYQQIS
ncbi:hypothetical protein AVEN_94988-1 [Araneus ventricosus]|uniref:Uncharacterized protein n=1 Tax=Araneus ventricosus TaxID=182803 RepID=A0A4Y2R5S8_ARAVE|nr:hypothetical protein AVEN_94988-1 [Araneus ventricosus]